MSLLLPLKVCSYGVRRDSHFCTRFCCITVQIYCDNTVIKTFYRNITACKLYLTIHMTWIKSNWVSILAIIISITAICISYFRVRPLEIDTDRYGILINSFSLMITLLIGWQIINVLTIKDEINKIAKKRIKKAVSTIKSDNAKDYAITHLFLIEQYVRAKNYGFALTILKLLYERLADVQDYTTADDVSASIMPIFDSFSNELDKDKIKQLIPVMEQLRLHSLLTDKILTVCKEIAK